MISILHSMAMIELQRDNVKSYCEFDFEAYRIAVETGDDEGLFRVGRTLGEVLIDAGEKEKGIAMLRRAYEIGKSKDFPGKEKIKEILVKHGEKIE